MTYRPSLWVAVPVGFVRYFVMVFCWEILMRLAGSGANPRPWSAVVYDYALIAAVMGAVVALASNVLRPWRVRTSGESLDIMTTAGPLRIPWTAIGHASIQPGHLRVDIADIGEARLLLPALRRKRKAETQKVSLSMLGRAKTVQLGRCLVASLPAGRVSVSGL